MTLPRRNRIDLHCHTARSDGVLRPSDLLAAMRDWGIALASITDHDTLDGYRELRAAGEGDGYPRLLPGVEINGVAHDAPGLWEAELHILGYGMDPDDATFEAVLADQRRLRAQRTDMIVERLRTLGMPVDEHLPRALGSEVTSRGRPHVARALVAAGHAESVEDAMRRILAHGAPGYVPRQGLNPREAIDAIRAAGGLASLAHFREAPDRPEVIERLCDWGLGGIEAYYVSFDETARAAVARVAAEHGLLATGGSDFHGDTWTYEQAQGACHVPDDVGEKLLAALAPHAAHGRVAALGPEPVRH
ncbi:MAG: PHP domain-containing protein [Candidatus Limnocylindrales bacterium]